MAETRRRIVHAADERIDPAVGVLDHPRLAVNENIVGVARHHAHLHSAGREQIVQTAIAFAGQQQIEPVLGRLPRRYQRSCQRLLSVAGGLCDLYVVWVEVTVADDPDLADGLQRLADHLQQRRSEIPGDAEIAGRAGQARRQDRPERFAAGGKALDPMATGIRPCRASAPRQVPLRRRFRRGGCAGS